MPRVPIARRLPPPEEFALGREPEEGVRRRRGDDVVLTVPDDVVRVDDVVQADVAVDAVGVVEEELAAVVLGGRADEAGDAATGHREPG